MARYRFLDDRREVEISRCDTPTPWINYLSNGTFHVMISQAGGGLAFYRSPQIWRINHYRFYNLPTDRSGFYTYIRDGESVFCPTWEPVREKPEEWSAVHGMGYTKFHSRKNGLTADARYFVGPEVNCLIWELNIKSDTDRDISVFPYVELGMMEYMREIQWQCYMKHQMQVYALDDLLVFRYGVENQPKPDETPLIYFASDSPVASYDGDRDEFVGAYRSEENPVGVERGTCSGSTMAGGDPCFAFCVPISLRAGEEKTVRFFLGAAMTEEEIRKDVKTCREADFTQRSFEALGSHWEKYFSALQCDLPDENARRMVNIWNPYQSERNFQFSRNISYYATGTFRGVGYRDTAQDVLAMIPYDTGRAREKIRLLLTQQYQDGHVNHYFFPTEGWDPVTTVHSDDHLWTVIAVARLCEEEGSTEFLAESVPWYDGGEGTIWEHTKRSITFTLGHLGERGFPLMLRSDWNDQLFRVCREGKGESIWTAMQFGVALTKIAELARHMGEDPTPYEAAYNTQKQRVNDLAWDGAWYRRAIMDSGRYVGSDAEPQAKIWLNSQTWSVISAMAENGRGELAMDSVRERLDTPMGIKKIDPSIKDYPSKEDPLTNYNKGCGENGAVFCHANTWAIIAECLLGRGDQAWHYYHQLLPMVAQEKAGEWRYKAEPYVYSSNIFGPESDKFGLANVSWLSGTAAWMLVAVTEYILGIRPVWEGLTVKPCVPSHWDSFKVSRVFRGVRYDITAQRGVTGVLVDGVPASDGIIRVPERKKRVEVLVGIE